MPSRLRKEVPHGDRNRPLYRVNDVPPWSMTLLLGLQHYLTAFGGLLSMPLLLMPSLCLGGSDVRVAEILGTQYFVTGIATLLQTSFGTRLPILQGPPPTFIISAMAILSHSAVQCSDIAAMTRNMTLNDTDASMQQDLEQQMTHEVFSLRMTEVQGAIMVASILQVLTGTLGIMGMLLWYIGPLAIAPTISLIGLSLYHVAAAYCEGQWWISIATFLLVIIGSQYLRSVRVPCWLVFSDKKKKKTGCRKEHFPIFQIFAVIIAIVTMWLICYILTVTDTVPDNPDKWGHKARVDTSTDILQKAAWFRFPYPFQWGWPTVTVVGVVGMLAAVVVGMVESAGDYYACARLAGAPPPPPHAFNRGVLVEGFSCLLAGAWGTGNGVTSFSENVGLIGLSKVGSRVVVQVSAVILIIFGMIGKVGAFFVTIPSPIIGGIFLCTFAMITAVGISNLQLVDLNSTRNLFIIGFSYFFGLTLPQWISSHPDAIQTGVPVLNQILTVLLSMSMFVGGTIGFILDNTIPGTEQERGMKIWRDQLSGKSHYSTGDDDYITECYDLPKCCMKCCETSTCLKYLPVCPSFQPSLYTCRKCRRSVKPREDSRHTFVDLTSL